MSCSNTDIYISGLAFHTVSKWSFCPRYPQRLEPENFEFNDLVFLNLDKFGDFINILRGRTLRNKFILITHNSDRSFTNEHWKIIEAVVTRVYVINNRCDNPNVVTIPIGFRDEPINTIPIIKEKIGSFVNSPDNKMYNKKQLVYMNFVIATNHAERSFCYHTLEQNSWVTKENNVSINTFYESLIDSKYVISPEGTGIDCHRIYESLYFNAVPIIKRTNSVVMNTFYEKLPVLMVNNWGDITEEFLENNYNVCYYRLIQWKADNPEWLFPIFWISNAV
jgi:hypothetical protein